MVLFFLIIKNSFQLDSLSLRIAESAPFKTHKYFRVAVPQALTGQTLVAFLQVAIISFDIII